MLVTEPEEERMAESAIGRRVKILYGEEILLLVSASHAGSLADYLEGPL